MLKVTAGTLRGRKLDVPDSNVRPVSSMARQALFNILGGIAGRSGLDLYAGAGTFGIEALSRGAARMAFVEKDGSALATLRRNLAACGLCEQSTVFASDVNAFFKRKAGPYDLVFIDPPFDNADYARDLGSLTSSELLSESAIVVVKHEKRLAIGVFPERIELFDERTYGRISLSFFRPRERGKANTDKKTGDEI
jgi:16S rRNA (guanine966-N2)-methyltransferase